MNEGKNPFLIESPAQVAVLPVKHEKLEVGDVSTVEDKKWEENFDKHKKRHVIKIANTLQPNPSEWRFKQALHLPGHCVCGAAVGTQFILAHKDGREVVIGSTHIENTIPYLISMGAEDLADAVETNWKKLLQETRLDRQREKGMEKLHLQAGRAIALDRWFEDRTKDVSYYDLPPYFQTVRQLSIPNGDTPARQAANMQSRVLNFQERLPLLRMSLGKQKKSPNPLANTEMSKEFFQVWYEAHEFKRHFGIVRHHQKASTVLSGAQIEKMSAMFGDKLLTEEEAKDYIKKAVPLLIELPSIDEIDTKAQEMQKKWNELLKNGAPNLKRIQEYQVVIRNLRFEGKSDVIPSRLEAFLRKGFYYDARQGPDEMEEAEKYLVKAQDFLEKAPDLDSLIALYTSAVQERKAKEKLQKEEEQRKYAERREQEEREYAQKLIEMEKERLVRRHTALKNNIERNQKELDADLDFAGKLERREIPGARWLKLMPEPFKGGTTIRQTIGNTTYVLRNEDRQFFKEGKESPYRDFRDISTIPNRRVILVELMSDADDYLARAAEKEMVIMNLKKDLREMEKNMGIETEKPMTLTGSLKNRLGKDTKFFNQ